jgi:hypothetical protein
LIVMTHCWHSEPFIPSYLTSVKTWRMVILASQDFIGLPEISILNCSWKSLPISNHYP